MTQNKPLPPIDAQSRAYWAACNEGQLLVQRCQACSHVQHYHRVLCIHCGHDKLTDLPVRGAGTVRSFTIIRRAVSVAFEADVPYVVALIELEEGPTVMSNLINTPLEQIAIGKPVQLLFERRSESIAIPQFQIVESSR
jgi:uncharacterized protein